MSKQKWYCPAKLSIFTIVILFFLVIFPIEVYSQAILDSSNISPTTVNVAPNGATVTADLWLKNTPLELFMVFVYLGDPDGETQATGFAELVEGTANDGKWRAQMFLYPSTPAGTYPVYVQAFDNAFNMTTINSGKTVQVTGGDSEPPSLAGEATISQILVDVSTGPKMVTVNVPLQDNFSGVLFVYPKFINAANQTIASNYATLISGTALNGTWQAIIEIPQKANGELQLIIDATDNAYNSADLITGKTLTVIGGDILPPVFVPPPTISPSTINVSSGDQIVNVTATLQDNFTKVKTVYFDFINSSDDYVASQSANLVSGDSLIGQWSADITIPQETEAGPVRLRIAAYDKANNYLDTLTNYILQVTRVPEAVVNFQVDLRRIERLGLFTHSNGTAYVEIFNGVNSGIYSLDDSEGDSIWTFQKALLPGQTITYAFAIQNNSPMVYELNGNLGGRTLNIPNANPITLPVVTFDNLPLENVDQNYAARVVKGFYKGNPYPYEFKNYNEETYVTIDYLNLDKESIVAVRRFAKSPGGSVPGVITNMASNIFWAIDKAPASVNFDAQVIFEYNLFGGISDPSSLRLLRRESRNQPWVVVTTEINLDQKTLSANVSNNFSEWTIGSISSANTLVPQAPGIVSNPIPNNGATQVQQYREFTWSSATAARTYDFYLWKSTDPVPSTPTSANLKEPRAENYSPMLYNTTYNWKVVAKNIVGNTSGPTWSFTTQSISDLIVNEIILPPTGFSGNEIDIQWIVKNIGNSITNTAHWYDGIYLSEDAILDTRSDTRLGIFENMNPLNPGESYVNSKVAKLPEGIFGQHYIIIVADIYGSIPETNETNNTSNKIFNVTLTPPPDLQVISMQIPDAAFSGQNIDLTYTVKNTGNNSTQTPIWYDAVYISQDSIFNSQNSSRLNSFYHNAILLSDSIYTKSNSVKIPDGISGKYFLFVITDYDNRVYEYTLENNNIRSKSIQITLAPPPDLVVTMVSGPASGNSGSNILVTWKVQNQGLGEAIGNWRDRIFISTVTPFDSTKSVFVKDFGRSHYLERDSSYTQTREVTLPNGISGNYFIFVETDWKKELFEYNFENNNILGTSTTTQINLSPWPDLIPTTIQKPDNATAGDVITISYTVNNQGFGNITSGQWIDSVYISSSATWNAANAIGIGSGFNSGLLPSFTNYSKSLSVKIPRKLSEGTYYLYIKTDVRNSIYEHTDEGNNILKSSSVFVKAYPPVDLSIVSLSTMISGNSGQPLEIQYSVKNIGTGNTTVSNWVDIIYLSADTTLNIYDDIFIARVNRFEPLISGAGYERNINPNLPNGISGNYYLIVKCDSSNAAEDVNLTNNIKFTESKIQISLTPSPDLQLISANVPSGGQAGQPLVISWSVKNNASNIPPSQVWNDAIYLSQNSVYDPYDISLGSISNSGPLVSGASYNRNVEVTLPVSSSGNYYILVKTDSRDAIYEHNAESNNLLALPITITLPPPADLVVTNITAPLNAITGKDVTVAWTIQNKGSNPATGRMSDAVYFSKDTTWDVSDPLLGIVLREINLNPGASLKESFKINTSNLVLADSLGEITADMPGLFTGEYHVIVRTNFKNNIREIDYTNNKKASLNKVNVDVISLPISVIVTDTIYRQDQNYYKVNVSDGVDLRIKAIGSSNLPSLDIYVAYGRMPSTSDYDYRTTDPLTLNREVFIPSTKAGYYFITVRSNSNVVNEMYTIIGEVLSFSITAIQPNKGGMGGQVTSILQGAGFRDSTKVYLYKAGEKVAEGNVLKFNSTMELKVRWNLKNIPLGVYDVVAINKDGSTVTLLDGFMVEPAREMVVSIGQLTPNLLLYGRKESYSFRFTNTSNVDIPYSIIQIEVPPGTEATISASPRLITRSRLIPDSLKLADGNFDDYVFSNVSQTFPLLVRDLIPGEAVECRITFRNLSISAGNNFPMSVGVRTFDKEAYLALQMSMIESSRQAILGNQSSFSPEVVAGAYNAQSFAQFMLEGYAKIGLLDQSDIPPLPKIVNLIEETDNSNTLNKSTFDIGAIPTSINDASSACEDFFNKLGCVAAVIDCFIPFPPIPPPFNFIMCGFGIAASCGPWDAGLAGCIGVASGLTCLGKELICKKLVASLDPNDIIGPEGYGDKQWVALNQTLEYQIRFENDPKKATAPAQRVFVTQQLDSTVDHRSFRLTTFGFANHSFEIPGNPSYYSTRLDLRDSLGIYVDFIAGIDITSDQISWSFKSIDPSTGELPFNPMVGLLPINDSTGRGNGFVKYTVRPKETSKTGDIVNAKARIIFDQNDPIDTPPIHNTIDAISPKSSIRPLASIIRNASFTVSWGGVDDSTGSLLKNYSIYVSANDSQYTPWLVNTTDTTATFTGKADSRYKFFSLATDNAGNTEKIKLVEDASTQIIVSVNDEQKQIPTEFTLSQNYPNPFNPKTIIRFGLPEKSKVVIKIYDILGSEVTTLVNEEMEAGWYQKEFNASRFASGVYIYQIHTDKFTNAKKMILLK